MLFDSVKKDPNSNDVNTLETINTNALNASTNKNSLKSDFDLVILDQGLPLMNGLKVIKQFIKKFGK